MGHGLSFGPDDRVLVLGGTGFVGRKLVAGLMAKNVRVRLLARTPSKVPALFPGADIDVVRGDAVKGEGLGEALKDVHTAYYLLHSMGGRSLAMNRQFALDDRKAAENFTEAATGAGLSRVIYLGGLGETGDELSEHLRSRAEVARIVSSGGPKATVLRAAIIIGAGGASFEMLRYLVERLPVMVCPRWIDTRIQPIALGDVIAYLTGCLFAPATAGKSYDICGPDVLTYREMIHRYAEARGLARRQIIRVPLLTPLLSAYWVDLVTPVPSGIAHPLIEGLKNEVVCKDNRIDRVLTVRKTPFKEAVLMALAEETGGPGITGF